MPRLVMPRLVMPRLAMLAAVTAIAAFDPAMAQTPRVGPDIAASKQDGTVRVQTSITFFLSGPTGESEEAQKLRDRARRLVYEMAGRECDVAREVLARECRLESVNSNISVQRQYSGQQQQEGFNVNGSMSLQVTLK